MGGYPRIVFKLTEIKGHTLGKNLTNDGGCYTILLYY